MDTEALIQTITSEVLRQLKSAEAGQGQPGAARAGKVLAIFTGGTIGLDQALTELRSIQSFTSAITVVLSTAAEKIIGTAKIRETLGGHVTIVTAQSDYPGKLLREADVVLVPVLTQNTAAKVAQTLADSLASTLIMQALMLGKPVVAAQNAADPEDDWRIKGKMGYVSPGLLKALKNNLQKLAEYGVQVVQADSLAAVTRQHLQAEAVVQAPAASPAVKTGAAASKKAVLTAAAIQEAARSKAKTVTVATGTIVTPLALETAREHGVEVVFR